MKKTFNVFLFRKIRYKRNKKAKKKEKVSNKLNKY